MADDTSWADETVAGAAGGFMAGGPVGAAIGGGLGLIGGLLGSSSNRRQMRQQLDAQREFAQHGIQWRVQDAKAAGLHPLYALGASTTGPTLSVMDDPLGRSVSAMGQDISRAAMAGASGTQRELNALNLEAARALRDKAFWEAAGAKAHTQRTIGGQQIPPAMLPSPSLISGQGDIPMTVLGGPEVDPEGFGRAVAEARRVQSRSWANPGYSAASTPLWDLMQTGPGNYLPVFAGGQPSEQFENPLALLWSLNEAYDRDPGFFRGSGMPFGVALNEFMDARAQLAEDINDLIDEISAFQTKYRRRDTPYHHHQRELYLMKKRLENRGGRFNYHPYHLQGR